MKLTVTINMDNAAFEPTNGIEVARILRYLAEICDNQNLPPTMALLIRDVNGNAVGAIKVKK